MGFVTPAPVALAWYQSLLLPQGQTGFLLVPGDRPPSITVVTGIDLVNPQLHEGANMVVQTVDDIVGTVELFQGFVYASSQAVFSWRGEIPLFNSTSIRAFAFVGNWSIHAYGASIPNAGVGP
jgi:hypothetical protein